MSVWDIYEERVSKIGTTRNAIINNAKTTTARMMYSSPSCHMVKINGTEQLMQIVHGKHIDEKRISSVPGEKLAHGGLVSYNDSMWLITELDGDNEINDRGIMRRCNHILRWIGTDGQLKEKWCVVEDGTKYLIGEFTERIMAIGDARIALTISKDKDTEELKRGDRFLIDDPDSKACLAYQITKPNKLFNVYDGKGVFKFILNEVQLTKDDNVELRIADYTKWHPDKPNDGDHIDSDKTVDEIVDDAIADANKPLDDNKEVWL